MEENENKINQIYFEILCNIIKNKILHYCVFL